MIKKENTEDTLTTNGVPLWETKEAYKGFIGKEPLAFRKYPDQSIAIIEYNTCGYNLNDEKVKEKLENELKEIFRLLEVHEIKNLFIDISRNGGGNSGTNNYLLSHIHSPKAVKLDYSIQNRFEPYHSNGPAYLDSVKTGYFSNTTPVNKKGYRKNIYLIQGRMSYSAAIGVAEWFKKSGAATIIGEETGQATACYIDTRGDFQLPNSHITFHTSFKDWKALPDGRYDQGILPDVPVKLDYVKQCYELEDLQNFIKEVEAKKETRK